MDRHNDQGHGYRSQEPPPRPMACETRLSQSDNKDWNEQRAHSQHELASRIGRHSERGLRMSKNNASNTARASHNKQMSPMAPLDGPRKKDAEPEQTFRDGLLGAASPPRKRATEGTEVP